MCILNRTVGTYFQRARLIFIFLSLELIDILKAPIRHHCMSSYKQLQTN